MPDPKDTRPPQPPARGPAPSGGAAPAGGGRDGRTPPPRSAAPTGRTPQPGPAAPGRPQSGPPSGRVVHDERGNAVWDWVKETSRIAIESTSRLLRRLDVKDLKVEGEKETELRIEGDGETGGGYDPYNQGKKFPRR